MISTVESYAIDSVDRPEVLRYMGYRGQSFSDDIAELVEAETAHCLELGRPRASIAVFDVAGVTDDGGTPVVGLVGTALELRGHSITEHLDGARAVGVLAVTVGMGVERELRRLSLVDRVAQVVFDAAATALVERAADAAEASVIGMAADRGLFCNYRFSPGYGDLPLETQPMLPRRPAAPGDNPLRFASHDPHQERDCYRGDVRRAPAHDAPHVQGLPLL